MEQKENGLTRKSVGIEMIDKGIPRHGYKVFKDGIEIGEVTTGTQSPMTKRNIGSFYWGGSRNSCDYR